MKKHSLCDTKSDADDGLKKFAFKRVVWNSSTWEFRSTWIEWKYEFLPAIIKYTLHCGIWIESIVYYSYLCISNPYRWHIRKNNVDEPIDGSDANQDFKASHRTHQSITLSSVQELHQPYQMKHNSNNNNSNQLKRIFVLSSGTLSLNDIKRSDAGVYICVASNTEGSETLEIQLSVIEALTVQILPAQQTVDLGKSTDLVNIMYLQWIHCSQKSQ